MGGRFPWTIRPCTSPAIQFLVTDADGSTVMMSEMYSIEDMLSLIVVFQRNPEIRVDAEAFAEQIEEWKKYR